MQLAPFARKIYIPAALNLCVALSTFAQAPGEPSSGGQGRPPFDVLAGPGPGTGQEIEVLKKFDQNGDKLLNATERKAAREFLQKERSERGGPRGFGGPPGGPTRFRRGGAGGPPGRNPDQQAPLPGKKIALADVKDFPGTPLYDPNTLRTFFLEFESADWEKELAEFHNTDVEVPAKLTVDGKTYRDVGVHFRGMSSLMSVGEGRKRSLNIAVDFVHADQNVGGYRTLNLLNGHEDPTFLRPVLFYDIARQYIPAPKANFVRVVINGENWGIYNNVQQFNKDFVKEWFGTTKGARWKVRGNPGGQGSLAYLGDDVAAYKRTYTIKTKDDAKAWADFIKLCKVLNETPPEKLEEALSPLLDIDGALKFIALDIALINNDGYWIRTSDYSIYQDQKGRFHIIPQDANETFAKPGGPGFGGPPGGPGGFGPGMLLAPQMLSQGDTNADQKLTKAELGALAEVWFDKLDPEKTGKVTQEQFADKFSDVLQMPQGFGPPGGGGGRGFGPGRFLGPGLFAAADRDKDGSINRQEFKGTFEHWASEWDSDKSGVLDEQKLRTGLAAVLPQPNFGGRGGPPGGPDSGPAGPGSGGRRGGRGFASMGPVDGVKLDPLVAAKDPNKPLISKLLAVPALRARYLGYVRDIAEKWLDWQTLGPIAEQYHALIADEVRADTRKLDSTEDFEKSLTQDTQGQGFGPFGRGKISLKSFADQRRAYLLEHPEVQKAPAQK